MRGELTRMDEKLKGLLDPGGISAEDIVFSRDGRYIAYVTFPEGVLSHFVPTEGGLDSFRLNFRHRVARPDLSDP